MDISVIYIAMKRWNIYCKSCGEREVFSDTKPSKCPVSRDHRLSPLSFIRDGVTFRRENRGSDSIMVELDSKGNVISETDGTTYKYHIPVEMPKGTRDTLISCGCEGNYFGVSVPPGYIPGTDVVVSIKFTSETSAVIPYSLYWINMGEVLSEGDRGEDIVESKGGVLQRLEIRRLSGKGKLPCGYIGGVIEAPEGVSLFTVEATFRCSE